MNKKNIKILMSLMIIVIVILNIFYISNNKVTKDEKKFKWEYERFNNRKNNDKKKYVSVNIENKNKVVSLSEKETVKLLEKGSGVIYFGYPECPWCRNMIEPLISAIEESGLTNFYYYNAYESRDEKSLDEDGNVITSKNGTKSYNRILELLGDKASVYEGLNDNSIKRLYFPTVVFVKEGKIKDIHVSTIDEQEDPYKKLTKKQQSKLKNIYLKSIKKIS